MGHTQSSMSEVLDSGLKWVLGQNASVARTPPTYHHPTGPTGARVARDTGSAENDPEQLHQILEQCHEASFDCLVRGGQFAFTSSQIAQDTPSLTFERKWKEEADFCQKAYHDCIISKKIE